MLHLLAFKWWFCLSIDYRKGSHRLHWEDPGEFNGTKLKFTGVPFYLMGCKILDCQHGKDRNAALEKKQNQEREQVRIKYITKLASLFIVQNMHKPYCFVFLSRMETSHLEEPNPGTTIKKSQLSSKNKITRGHCISRIQGIYLSKFMQNNNS